MNADLESAARKLCKEIRRCAPPMVNLKDVEVAAALEILEGILGLQPEKSDWLKLPKPAPDADRPF